MKKEETKKAAAKSIDKLKKEKVDGKKIKGGFAAHANPNPMTTDPNEKDQIATVPDVIKKKVRTFNSGTKMGWG